MTPLQSLYKDVEEKMKRAVTAITREFNELRGGRATPGLVENITVEYFGSQQPIKTLAAVSVPDARMVVIQPWDAKLTSEIEKAIQKAGLGITPVVDGKIVRLQIPSLTGERRQELVRLIHKVAEEGRVSVRGARRDGVEAIRKLKHENKATEDDVSTAQTQIQKLTDQHTNEINHLVKSKEHELQAA